CASSVLRSAGSTCSGRIRSKRGSPVSARSGLSVIGSADAVIAKRPRRLVRVVRRGGRPAIMQSRVPERRAGGASGPVACAVPLDLPVPGALRARLSAPRRERGPAVKSFDLIVLGGGSGGLATVQRAAEYGAKVVLFEPARLGGTCVNVGCVPKKVMWNAAELARAIENAPYYGFDVRTGAHDWAKLKRGRDAYVARLNDIYRRNLERRNIEVVPSKGRFAAPHEIVDDAGERYTAPHILIATGGYPCVPELPGAELGITSDGFFELEERPQRVAIVGSGYIAVELGGVLRALGSDVTIFVRFDRVLRSFDTLLSDHLMTHMKAAGIEIVPGGVPAAVHGPGPLTLELVDGRRYGEFDALLWAIGRLPNTEALALENAGITPTASGHVPVDDFQNTEVE